MGNVFRKDMVSICTAKTTQKVYPERKSLFHRLLFSFRRSGLLKQHGLT